MTIKRFLIATTIAATLVAGGAAVADAAPQRHKRPAAEAAETMARRLVPRAVHAEFVVKTKDGFETIDIDRGQLTSKDGNTLHVHRPDGVDVTVTLTDSTRYRGVDDADGLQQGKPVVVVSKAGNAVAVAQRPAKS